MVLMAAVNGTGAVGTGTGAAETGMGAAGMIEVFVRLLHNLDSKVLCAIYMYNK